MPAGRLTAKQSAFLDTYLSNGRNGAAAYRRAYDTRASNRTAAEEASKLLKHPQIAPRLLLVEKQATDRTIANVAITKERVIEMLIEDRELARAARQASAAVRATELIGKELFRMFVDRREQGKPGDFDKLPREELEQSIVDELRAGGIPEEYALAFLETREQSRH